MPTVVEMLTWPENECIASIGRYFVTRGLLKRGFRNQRVVVEIQKSECDPIVAKSDSIHISSQGTEVVNRANGNE